MSKNTVLAMKRKVVLVCIFLCPAFFVFVLNADDALVLYRQKKYTEAASQCLGEIKKNPANLDSYVVLSWALLANRQYHQALKWIVKGRTVSHYDPRLIESHALVAYYLGRNIESLRLFEDYIAYVPHGTKLGEVYYYIGELYLRTGQYNHADIAFSAAVQLQRLNGQWWVRLGYSREQAQEYHSAIKAYRHALQLNKNAADAKKGYERVLKQL